MMEIFLGMLGILLVVGAPAAVSTYLTSIPCRILVSRRRIPGWYIAILIAVLVGGLAVLLLGGADLFHPSKWDSGKVTLRELAPLWFAAASICAFIPAWYVVGHYRDKLDEPNHEL
jgi:hypothetical protein